jgi:hypothetical protein
MNTERAEILAMQVVMAMAFQGGDAALDSNLVRKVTLRVVKGHGDAVDEMRREVGRRAVGILVGAASAAPGGRGHGKARVAGGGL